MVATVFSYFAKCMWHTGRDEHRVYCMRARCSPNCNIKFRDTSRPVLPSFDSKLHNISIMSRKPPTVCITTNEIENPLERTDCIVPDSDWILTPAISADSDSSQMYCVPGVRKGSLTGVSHTRQRNFDNAICGMPGRWIT